MQSCHVFLQAIIFTVQTRDLFNFEIKMTKENHFYYVKRIKEFVSNFYKGSVHTYLKEFLILSCLYFFFLSFDHFFPFLGC